MPGTECRSLRSTLSFLLENECLLKGNTHLFLHTQSFYVLSSRCLTWSESWLHGGTGIMHLKANMGKVWCWSFGRMEKTGKKVDQSCWEPCAQKKVSQKKKKKKDTRNQGLTRWPSNQEHLLLLQRTWVRFPEPPWWLKNFYYSSSRGSNALFWILWAPGIYVVHIHTCRQTLLHVKWELIKERIPSN